MEIRKIREILWVKGCVANDRIVALKDVAQSQSFYITHCLEITQNVSFEFFNFGIFRQFLSF